MSEQLPNNTNSNEKGKDTKDTQQPYRTQDFDTFCMWCAVPTMFRGKPLEYLKDKFFIDDEFIQELCQIKSMKEFAVKYDVDATTLTRWKKLVEDRDVFQDIRKWVRKVNKNVVASAYRSAMSKDPKAHQDRKLMLQLDGWSEEQNLNIKGEGLFDLIKRGLEIK